ncbi:MAG: GspE/PulE family protein [Candidatus Babeliales bacterium]|jgi:type II secretory ATPase GspE/PulE/Tfp pilus assembly ATPase PilB-like protein
MLAHGGSAQSLVYALLSHEEKLKRGLGQDPVIALVDTLLYEAVTLHASDIHLQPAADAMMARYRIDGVLYQRHTIECEQALAVVSRLKVLANLDIAERRIPQDGRLRAAITLSYSTEPDRLIDFRLSTYPTLYGEKMVVRIFDRSSRLLSLDSLGLQKNMYNQLGELMRQPHGLFLVTGPTGCGKTTMLYALISSLDVGTRNIVTIEDPIEYEIAGITQSHVNNKAGFTFENGLRAILRQDPDVIMVGEIRDKPTAHIAVESALTGHLVLSTLHTNDAPSAVARLVEMGIEPFLISATLTGVLAQRLVRRLCAQCKKQQPLDETQKIFVNTHGESFTSAYAATGCRRCHHLGYDGRMGIFELLTMNDALRELVMQKAGAAALSQAAHASGMKPLVYDGVTKVAAGATSLDEVFSLMVT